MSITVNKAETITTPKTGIATARFIFRETVALAFSVDFLRQRLLQLFLKIRRNTLIKALCTDFKEDFACAAIKVAA